MATRRLWLWVPYLFAGLPLIALPRLIWRWLWERPVTLRAKLELVALPWALLFATIGLDHLAYWLGDDARVGGIAAQLVSDVHALIGTFAATMVDLVVAPLRIAAALPSHQGYLMAAAYLWLAAFATSLVLLAPFHVAVCLHEESLRGGGRRGLLSLHTLSQSRAARLRQRALASGAWFIGLSRSGGAPVTLRRSVGDHAWFVGGGRGADALIRSSLHAEICAGRAVIFVDSSGDIANARQLYAVAEAAGRGAAFRYFHLHDHGRSWGYAPFRHGTDVEVRDKIIDLARGPVGVEVEAACLDLVIALRHVHGAVTPANLIAAMTSRESLADVAGRAAVAGEPLLRWCAQWSAVAEGFAELSTGCGAALGGLLAPLFDTGRPSIDIAASIRTGLILYAGLPTTTYGDAATRVARLLLADIDIVARHAVGGGRNAVSITLRDGSDLGIEWLPGLLQRGAAAGMGFVVAQRSISDDPCYGRWFDAMARATDLKVCLRPQIPSDSHVFVRMLGSWAANRTGHIDAAVELLESLGERDGAVVRGHESPLEIVTVDEPAAAARDIPALVANADDA